MTDHGAGVHDIPEEPVNGRVGPAVPRDKLTCPACGDHDHAERSTHPEFPFLCGACWTLFAGTTLEWRLMRTQREAAIKRRENPPASLPPVRFHRSQQTAPSTERSEEHDDQ